MCGLCPDQRKTKIISRSQSIGGIVMETKIKYNGMSLSMVGCRKCERALFYLFRSRKGRFYVRCRFCGHMARVFNKFIVHKKDIPSFGISPSQTVPVLKDKPDGGA